MRPPYPGWRDLANYGEVLVIDGIDLSVEQGQKVAVLGPNGAGKTTVPRALCGMVDASGRSDFDVRSLVGTATADITRRGAANLPEGRGIFPPLSVEET
jgi:branched-chain amino acid transport system ATP-binding protein